jgi:hypothetical protein
MQTFNQRTRKKYLQVAPHPSRPADPGRDEADMTAVAHDPIVFVEFADGRPHEVVTRGPTGYYRYFDVDWCKKYQRFCWHQSGGGPMRPTVRRRATSPYVVTYWAADGVEVDDENPSGLSCRLDQLPGDYPMSSLLDPAEEEETIWCDVCRDHLPYPDCGEPCDHIWWCGRRGWWSEPGDRCGADCGECVGAEREVKVGKVTT